jgi:hypothetical protein
VELYSAIKKNEIMSFAGKWMELGITLTTQTSSTKRSMDVFFHLWKLGRVGHKVVKMEGGLLEREKRKEKGEGAGVERK